MDANVYTWPIHISGTCRTCDRLTTGDHICFRTPLTADTAEYPSRGSVLGLGKWVMTQQQSKNLQAHALFWKYR